MKWLVVLLVLFGLSAAITVSHTELDQYFKSFKVCAFHWHSPLIARLPQKKFHRHYKTRQEEKQRKEIFLKNLKEILEHNEKYDTGKSLFRMGVNKFADLTGKEFRKYA